MELKLIRTSAEYAAATAEIERLWGARIGSRDGDRLDVLMVLVEDYERRHAVEIEADPVDLLEAHMEATGRTQHDLAKLFGSASRASEILARKRALSKQHIHKISDGWGVPADLLIAPYELKTA